MNWISVKDRLPGPGERVIFTTDSFTGEGWMTGSRVWVRNTITVQTMFGSPVTHWQPMPDAPEGEK